MRKLKPAATAAWGKSVNALGPYIAYRKQTHAIDVHLSDTSVSTGQDMFLYYIGRTMNAR